MTLPALLPPDEDAQASEALTPAELQSAVIQMLDQAKAYAESTLAPFRQKATEYYHGKPFGNEVDGRSQFVVTTLKDTVNALMPDLIEVFSGSDKTVEFRARHPEDVPEAEQRTETVNYVVNQQNGGFLMRHAVFKDAMIRRLGIVKAWWEPGTASTTTSPLMDCTEEQLVLLNNDPSVLHAQVTGTNPQADGTFLFDLTVTRTVQPKGRICVEAVPPEEYVWTPNARNQQDALLVAHVTTRRRDVLLGMGFSDEELDAAGPSYGANTTSVEAQARQPQGVVEQALSLEDTDLIDYAECYCYLPIGPQREVQLAKVCVLGTGTVARVEPCDRRPFALYMVDPEPHSMVPQCIADQTMDLQLLESTTMRAILDSAAQTLNPGIEAVVGQVQMEDLMNQEIGRVVRVKAPGMMRDLVTPFVGKEMLPMLAYTQEIREQRTGVSKAAAGLAPDSLQSSTHVAVAATVSGSQKHLKMLARMLAEGERQLYALVAQLLIQYQDRALTIRLRNQYVEVDPRYWQADMDCVVNVALGSGSKDEQRAILTEQAARQENILLKLGPSNPLCTLGQYRETLAKLAELGGIMDASKVWKPLPADWEPPPAEPKETPEEVYARLEEEKLLLQAQKETAELALRRDQMEVDAYLKGLEISAQYHVEVNDQKLQMLMAEQRSRPKEK